MWISVLQICIFIITFSTFVEAPLAFVSVKGQKKKKVAHDSCKPLMFQLYVLKIKN